MQKPSLHPLRLMRLNEYQLENDILAEKDRDRDNNNIGYPGKLADSMKVRSSIPIENRETSIAMPSPTSQVKQAQRDIEAQGLLRRTPNNYLFSQAYGLWLYLSLFAISLILTHTVSTTE